MAVYAFSDIHGTLDLWNQIKAILKPNDTVFFLGDAADRNIHGWQIIKEIIEDKRIIYLKGNHEQLLIDAFRRPNNYDVVCKAYSNGGMSTLEDALEDDNALKVIRDLMKLPLYAEYVNTKGQFIFMSHSGSWNVNNEFEMMWDRKHFKNSYVPEPYSYIIHGHTPIPFILQELDPLEIKYPERDAALYYGENRNKICLDCGSCWTGIMTLLNLDTFEETILHTNETIKIEN